ncbi:MAG: prolyl oligopeptidase family serine peptidase [Clostridia bacterium]|nr:prolyl oligopeptidase family serine peptidase [Clostridia bacterium]
MKHYALRVTALFLALTLLLCGCQDTPPPTGDTNEGSGGGTNEGSGNTGDDKNDTGNEENKIVIDKTHPDYLRDVAVFGELSYGEKTVAEQRAEIRAAMELAKNTTVEYTVHPYINGDARYPVDYEYRYIQAITYDGLDMNGSKTSVFAYYGVPEGASAEEPVPAVVLIHGGGGHAYLEWVKHWNDLGYAAIAMETTGEFPTYPGSCTDEYHQVGKTAYAFGEFFDPGEGYVLAPTRDSKTTFAKEVNGTYREVSESWAYHAMAAVILGHNVLRQDARVDSDRIGITGISWGGVLASMVIGYDNRFAFAMPVYGTAYLGEGRPFSDYGNEYVDALWGAAHNLHNATMPILWLAWLGDSFFCMDAYTASLNATKDLNEKTTLSVRPDWTHSHQSAYLRDNHSVLFANSVCFGTTAPVTFEAQPSGRTFDVKLRYEGVDPESIKTTLYYLRAPIRNSSEDDWQTDTEMLYFDSFGGTDLLSGVITDTGIYGYFVLLEYTLDGEQYVTSSGYVALK